MVAFASTVALLLPLVALAAPTSKNLVEDKPWCLTQITVFTAVKTTNAPSYIDFVFNDSNKGLELTTKCTHFILPHSAETITSDQQFACANQTVGVSFNGKRLSLKRTYRDDSVGAPPYNYVTAFGDGNTTFTTKTGSCGTTQTMSQLEVPITALIA